MRDIYADTISAINFNNGLVRMYLVDQDPVEMSKEGADPSKIQPQLKHQLIMPLPGFLYAVSVVRNLVEDPKMQDMLKKYAELGLLPAPAKEAEAVDADDGAGDDASSTAEAAE